LAAAATIELSPAPLLVVDDEERMRALLARTLTAPALPVVTAPGAGEALALVRRLRPAAVVSDYAMAPRDGLELLADVRAFDGALPFVLVSSLFPAGVRERAERAGVTLVLEKRTLLDEPATLWHALFGECATPRVVAVP
jgi:CheY-like chemotaxis protein